MAQPGAFFPNQYQPYSYVQAMWSFHNYIKSLNINVGRNQCRVLLNQFVEGINAADQCEKQHRGHPEIQDLHNLLLQIKDHYVFRQSLHWSQIGHKKQEFDYQLDQIARALDGLLMRFGMLVGRQFHSTIALIQRARTEDDSWLQSFIKTIDQESAQPGSFEQAYHSQDTNSMNTMTEGILQNQGSLLAQDNELREEAVKHATEISKWIMGVTKQKFKSGINLGSRLVGEPKYLLTTQRNVIFTAEYVSGEIVALKIPHNRMQGEDPKTTLTRFQDEVHLWFSLRYDHILPFYGVGMMQAAGRTRIYGVSPYLPNHDAVTYRKEHPFSVEVSLQIAVDSALALKYLHERDPPTVHFNMCTQNILIDNAGRGVLGGFSLSTELPASGSQSSTNPASLPTEMPRFRAPEYHNDSSFPIKTSADVWGWAMTALELVSGEAPFYETTNDFQAITAMVRGERPNRDAHPGVEQLSDPDALWQLLEECWAHEESKRPDMAEVVLRIKGIRDGQNELGRRDPPVVPAPGPRRQRQGSSVEPVDGRANQATEQGRLGQSPQGGRGR
ncbi:kinase-like protein [Ceratobasidium sp. AG-I]|nr:kinase-like protein [Ceratobasidium sp. AG-I]